MENYPQKLEPAGMIGSCTQFYNELQPKITFATAATHDIECALPTSCERPTTSNQHIHGLLLYASINDAYVLMTYDDVGDPNQIHLNVVPHQYVEKWNLFDEAIKLAFWLEHQREILLDWMGKDATEDQLAIEIFFDDINGLDDSFQLIDGYQSSVPFSLSALRLGDSIIS